MATSTTPVWSQAVSVIAAQVLARGGTLRGTLDLRGKLGARVFMRMGRGGTTALSGGTTPGVQFSIRAENDNGVAGNSHPSGIERVSLAAAAAGTTCATSNSNSGQPVLTVASGTGFAAGDMICIQDSGGGVTRLEFQKLSKVSGATLTCDDNLEYTHTSAGADTVRNQASVFPTILLPGGSLYVVVIDYGDDTAGESVTVVVTAQTYDSILNT